jgi:hypothetical protein
MRTLLDELLEPGDLPLQRAGLATWLSHLETCPEAGRVVRRARLGPELLCAARGEVQFTEALEGSRRRAQMKLLPSPAARSVAAELRGALRGVEAWLREATQHADRPTAADARGALQAWRPWGGWPAHDLDPPRLADAAAAMVVLARGRRWEDAVMRLRIGGALDMVWAIGARLDGLCAVRPDQALWLDAEASVGDAAWRLLRALATAHRDAPQGALSALDRALRPLWAEVLAQRARVRSLRGAPAASLGVRLGYARPWDDAAPRAGAASGSTGAA